MSAIAKVAFVGLGNMGGPIAANLVRAGHAVTGADAAPGRAAQWAALIGVVLISAGQYFSNVPYSIYSHSEFWLDSPWLTAVKLGVILLILSFSYLWTRHSARNWSWIRQFGVTSLLVYWVHIELMYGRWLWFFKGRLTNGQTAAVAVAFIVLMLLLSIARTQWKNWRTLGLSLGWYFFLACRAREQE